MYICVCVYILYVQSNEMYCNTIELQYKARESNIIIRSGIQCGNITQHDFSRHGEDVQL